MDWIIGIGGTNLDGVILYKFNGTVQEVKQKLLDMVKEDKASDIENWDFGTEILSEVLDQTGVENEFYAYGCYYDYHIDYTARKLNCLSNANE